MPYKDLVLLKHLDSQIKIRFLPYANNETLFANEKLEVECHTVTVMSVYKHELSVIENLELNVPRLFEILHELGLVGFWTYRLEFVNEDYYSIFSNEKGSIFLRFSNVEDFTKFVLSY